MRLDDVVVHPCLPLVPPWRSALFRRLAALILGLPLAVAALPAGAETHALLAGVSRYDHLPADKQLSAPGNDVARMRDALTGWGVPADRITILSDGVTGARGRPTRAALLAELDRLGRPGVVAAGDWVVIYLSGHGATAADAAGLQMSGLNSLFLPADARLVPGQAPQNALYDTEIGTALSRIRALGAHVWFINDSCHSGDSVRAQARDDVRDKSVLAPARRKPAAARLKPLAASAATPGPNGGGRLVAFYAAQVTEAARELRLEGEWSSAFTLALTRAMAQSTARDARSLASRTVLGVRALRANGIYQTPYADADLADGLRLLGGAEEALPQNRAEGSGDTLLAGALEGFDTGAEIAVYGTAGAPEPVARGRIVQGGLSRSTVAATDGALPENGWFAQLTLAAPERRLSIAADSDNASGGAGVLDDLIRQLSAGTSGFASMPVAQADVLVGISSDGVRLTPRKALHGVVEAVQIDLKRAPPAPEAVRTALLRLDFLRRIEQAEALAAAVPGVMRLQLRSSFRRFAGQPGATCPPIGKDAAAQPLPTSATVSRCDAIEVEIRNQGDKPRHIQVLAIHNDGTVQSIAPRCGAGTGLKLEPGQATAARHSAAAASALPVVWFLVPRPRLPGPGRMAVKILSFPTDAATTAPDPCQFERFNGATVAGSRGSLAFEDGTRSSAARPGEILMQSRILEWPAP